MPGRRSGPTRAADLLTSLDLLLGEHLILAAMEARPPREAVAEVPGEGGACGSECDEREAGQSGEAPDDVGRIGIRQIPERSARRTDGAAPSLGA